jgi:hypothetical protein
MTHSGQSIQLQNPAWSGMTYKKLNLTNIATIAEILAAVGVMISVIYLAVQIDSGNKELRAQTYSATLDRLHRPTEMIVESQELSDLVATGISDPDKLSEKQWPRFFRWQSIRFDAYEFAYYAHLNDAITPELWIGLDNSITTNIQRGPGVRRAWREMRHGFADPFQSYVDGKISAVNTSE